VTGGEVLCATERSRIMSFLVRRAVAPATRAFAAPASAAAPVATRRAFMTSPTRLQ
jgi:hypothetical protein